MHFDISEKDIGCVHYPKKERPFGRSFRSYALAMMSLFFTKYSTPE